jgi:proteasome lid subunit RPN8/RPN11
MSEGNKNLDEHNEMKEENAESEAREVEQSDMTQKEKIGKPVIISAEAYKTIILYASRYSNRSIPSKDWKEIYGVLVGFSDDDFVHVVGAEALTFGHDTDVVLDNRHLVFISEIQDKLVAQGNTLYIVGWFHSHPGLGLFFSDIDLRNQTFFQTHEDGIGLVFDHTLLGKKKQEKQEDSEFIITKYDTGFEIYRISDTSMDVNAPGYNDNYHKVDYIVDGLNKFFFANVLSELSALVSEGKPLQSAYGESNITKLEAKESFSPFDSSISAISDDTFLTEIPMNQEINFSVDDFTQEKEKKQKELYKREIAEQLIYEGNQAFSNKDAVAGIEKFREGIDHYKNLKEFDKVMDLLRTVAQKCITNDHLIFAQQFGENLLKLSKKHKNLFYQGVSNYIFGYILLKSGESNALENGLNKIQEAAVNFENEGDYAGAGMCFNKIGNIYQSRLSLLENACLFYRAAVENYNQAIIKMHPLRKSFWNKPDLLIEKIVELKDTIEELLPSLENIKIKKKIIDDLQNIRYNF